MAHIKPTSGRPSPTPAPVTYSPTKGGKVCCNIDQNDTIGKIKLIPSSVLSSKSAISRNDIQ